jgi:hypothetical protein
MKNEAPKIVATVSVRAEWHELLKAVEAVLVFEPFSRTEPLALRTALSRLREARESL